MVLERWTTEAPEDLGPQEVAIALVLGMAFGFWIMKRLPVGFPRLVALLPLFSYYFTIPWRSPFVQTRAILSLFCFWMIPFKLALFCWDLGPVAADPSILQSFPRFFATVSFSIRIRASEYSNSVPPWTTVLSHTAVKLPSILFLLKCYAFADQLPDLVLHFVYSVHIYLGVSLVFEILGIFAWAAFGVELEASFDEPYLATSVSEFWGRRWNLLVNSVLRAAVYDPLFRGFLSIAGFGLKDEKTSVQLPQWPRLCSLLGVFVVSGLMHELIFLCMNKSKATWEVSCFFLLHGLITAAESIVRKRLWQGQKRVPKVLAIAATMFCNLVTATWLFFPPLAKPGTISKALQETQLLLDFLHARIWSAHKIQPLQPNIQHVLTNQ